ncbi:MAG: response regulator [Oscillatoriales cyanobacterium C42_A2020_001]|nr:response regulator [Leptolyngbyaceae cyanobacterium C42_A2020_001]
MSQCVTAVLVAVDEVVQTEIEQQVFEVIVEELHAAFDDALIAIALPNADSEFDQEFTLHHVAISRNRADVSEAFWQDAFGQIIAFEEGQVLAQADLDALRSRSTCVYPIIPQQHLIGWLLVHSSLITISKETVSPNTLSSFLASFIDQSVQQCNAALKQIGLILAQRQQYQTVLLQNRELQQTNLLKNQFLANTSHEIRTPLSSILGFTHLLLQQGYNPANLRHQEYLNIILSSGKHLLALINDILDLSKIEANQLTLEWSNIDIANVCQTAMTLIREKASDKGLELRLEVSPTATTLVADELRLKQMLFNLLSNAVKFTVKGAIGLQVVPAHNFLHFTVWDTGTGISHEEQALLFKPYSQITNAAVSRDEGTGLGLVLTQKLAELHGGWVEVISEVNHGSRFTLVLPMQPIAFSQVNSAQDSLDDPSKSLSQTSLLSAQTHEALPLSNLDSPRFSYILLVEDNLPNAKLLLTYLGRMGYEVSWAEDGQAMWQALEQSMPALILMDIDLPDVSGMTLIQQIRTDDRFCCLPVIAQTAMAMKGDRDRCLQAGATDYISKPIDLENLATLILKYVPQLKPEA